VVSSIFCSLAVFSISFQSEFMNNFLRTIWLILVIGYRSELKAQSETPLVKQVIAVPMAMNNLKLFSS
jgi:hypothetical protein